jgi:CheY-like chemotaxis protein
VALDDDENFLFAEEDPEKSECAEVVPFWRILVVDDEEEIHSITKMVLNEFTFSGMGLSVVSAYSADEAIQYLDQEPDFAVAVLDVVMETDDAGFKVVEHIRNTLKNERMRLIMRTGQPGQIGTEYQVVLKHPVNDVQLKTQLTDAKFKAMLHIQLADYCRSEGYRIDEIKVRHKIDEAIREAVGYTHEHRVIDRIIHILTGKES